MNITQRIDKYRKLRSVTVENLAEEADIKLSSFYTMRRDNNFKISVLKKLAKVLNINFIFLLVDNPDSLFTEAIKLKSEFLLSDIKKEAKNFNTTKYETLLEKINKLIDDFS